MSRSKWLALGALAVLVGCANGTSDEGDDLGDDASLGVVDGASDAKGPTDARSGHDDARGSGDDTGAGDDAGTGDDTGTGDTGTGDDTGAGDDGGADAEPDDATVADANAPDTDVPDTNVPDTNVPDTSVPDTGIKDTGPDTNVPDTGVDAGCSPVTGGLSTAYHAPVGHATRCLASDVQGYYDACFGPSATNTTCNNWINGNTLCASCLRGNVDPSGSSWGPEVDWPLGSTEAVVEVNVAGCIALGQGKNNCSVQLEYLSECEHRACDGPCGSVGFDGYEACATEADNNGAICKTYASGVSSACASVTSSACDFPPSNALTFEQLFLDVAKVFCE